MADPKQRLESLALTAENVQKGVRVALDSDVRQEKRKTAVFVIVVVGMICYMTWMLNMVKELNADDVLKMASDTISDQVPVALAVLTNNLEDSIRKLSAEMEVKAMSTFEKVTEQADVEARKLFSSANVQVRTYLLDESKKMLDEIHGRLKTAYPHASNDQLAEMFVHEVTANYANRIRQAMDDEHHGIFTCLNQLDAYVDKLTAEKLKDESLRLEQEFISAVVAVVQQNVANHTDMMNPPQPVEIAPEKKADNPK